MTQPNRVGKYEVLSVLRSAPFGQKLLGRDPSLDREVTIWSVHESAYASSPAAWERIVSLLSQIQSAACLQLLGQEQLPGWRYLVLEHTAAASASEFLRAFNGPREETALRLAESLGEGLTSLHRAGLALGEQWDASVFIDANAYPSVDPVPACLLMMVEQEPQEGSTAAPGGADALLAARIAQDIRALASLVAALLAGPGADPVEWVQSQGAQWPAGSGAVLAQALSPDEARRFRSISAFVDALRAGKSPQVPAQAKAAAVAQSPAVVVHEPETPRPARTQGCLAGVAKALGVSMGVVTLLFVLAVLGSCLLTCVYAGLLSSSR
jgi:hypothetical protein